MRHSHVGVMEWVCRSSFCVPSSCVDIREQFVCVIHACVRAFIVFHGNEGGGPPNGVFFGGASRSGWCGGQFVYGKFVCAYACVILHSYGACAFHSAGGQITRRDL